MQPVHPIFTKLDKLLCSLFEKHAYKPSTIRTYERNLQLVEDYLSQRGTDYCPDIGNEFSLEYVSLNSAVQSRCTSMKRTIRRLNDCYYGKGIVLMPQKERKSLPNDFEMALSQYSIWCAENGNAPSTIKKKMYALQLIRKASDSSNKKSRGKPALNLMISNCTRLRKYFLTIHYIIAMFRETIL